LNLSGSNQFITVPNFTTTGTDMTFSFWFKSINSPTWCRLFDFGNGAGRDNIIIFIYNNNLGCRLDNYQSNTFTTTNINVILCKLYSVYIIKHKPTNMSMYDFFTLETLRTKIEKMQKDRHIQCLNILVKYPSITINEHKYGSININLSCVPKEAIDDLLKFVSYVEDQENSLMMAEEQKKKYQEDYFAYNECSVSESRA
jgi:hypothetical protein